MCLAIPGKVISITDANSSSQNLKSARVVFGGIEREINISCLPEVKVDDYIIAHAGVGLQVLDEQDALSLIAELQSLSESNQ